MAIYISQVEDYIPQIQPFKPDFNFYAGALQMKQGQYDAAYNKLSSVYGTLLNSPMLREGNIAKRDQFFKDADTQIKKIAGLDLSRPENVDAAMAIFKPFYDDKQLVKDMTWTRQYQNELTRADNFRNCIDPKKCGGQYWEGGVEALHYRAQDFRNASDEDALGFASPKFTPFINVSKEALDAAKEAGFNIQTDTVRGGYIITTKNGQQLEQPLQEFFMGLFGNNPAVMEMFRTQAYIQRKQFVTANTQTYGSEAAAEQAYISRMTAETTSSTTAAASNTNTVADGLAVRKQAADKAISNKGLILNTPEHAAYSDLLQQIQQVNSTKTVYEQATNLTQTAPNLNNLEAMRGRVDDIVAYGLLSGEMANAAHLYAYRDYQVKMTADPFALQASQQSFDLKKLMLEKGYFDDQGNYHAGLDAMSQAYINKMKAEGEATQVGTAEQNNMVPDNTAEGTNAKDNVKDAKTLNTEKRTEVKTSQSSDEKEFLRQMALTLQTEYAASVGHKDENGDDDGGTRQGLLKDAAYKTFQGTGLDVNKILAGTEDLTKLDKLSGTSVSTVYQRALKISDPKAPIYGTTNDFWNQSLWDKTADVREGVKNRSIIMADLDKFYQEQNQAVIKAMGDNVTSSGDDAGKERAGIQTLTNADGTLKTKQQFIDDYAKTNISLFYEDTWGILGKEFRGNSYTGVEANQRARDYAEDNYDDLVENYNSTYIKEGRAYNANPNMAGQSGGVESGGAVSGIVDANNVKSRNTAYASSIFNNLNTMDLSGKDGGAYVKYGGAGEKSQDTGAQSILTQLMSDFYTEPTKGRKKPVFKMRYQTIAASDANYSAVTFFPGEEWAKKYKGSKTSPGLTFDGKYKDGITVLIPKSEEKNDLAEHSKYDDYEFVMQHAGKLSLDQYPSAGSITLQKSGQGYQASGYINKYDQAGNSYREPVYQFYGADFNVGAVYLTWQDQLKYYSQYNQAINSAITSTYGVKDPAQVPPYSK